MAKPKIRFKGYEDDWEQRKLGEIADLTSSKRVHAQDYVDSGIPFYRGKEISELREHKPVSEVLYITEEKYKEIAKLYGSPQVGDLLITAVGTIGNTWVVDNVPFYFKDGNLIWFKNIKCNPNYLDYVLSSDDGQKKIDASAIGSNQKALTMVKLNELKFMFPNDNEQVKIADYFRNLDHLITLHQQKCNETKKLKKYMLQKMFPEMGEKTPKIRFKGFTDDWEQRKLGEYVSITSGEAPSKFEEGTELYVKVDDLNYNDKYVVDTQNKVAEHSTVKRVTKGSVVFPKRGAAIMTNKVRILGIDSYMDTNMMALTSERLDSEFLYNIISKEGLYKIADTSTIPQINNKHIEPYEVKIPSLDEQRRIGVYFKQLDHLITLHQQKCEELQKIKKFMLQNMFV